MRNFIILAFATLTIGCSSFGGVGANRFFVEKRWVRNTLVKEHQGSERQHRFSPVITSDLVIQGNAIDGVVAYDRKTANPRWRIPIRDGSESGAVIDGDTLLFGGSDGFFYAVKLLTGEIRWTYPIRSESLGQPYASDGVVYFVAGNNVLHAIDIQSGKLVWVYTRRDASNLSIRGGSQPNVAGEYVYAGFSDGFLVAIKKSSGALVWEVSLNRNKRFRDVDAHPIIDGDRIFVPSYDGALYALNKSDGRVLWSVEEGGESAVTLLGNRLYVSTSSGKVLALDKDSGKVLWSFQTSTGIAVRPAIYREMVIAGEMRGALVFLDSRTGQKISEFHPGWGVSSEAVVDADKNEVYFMSSGANLYSLRLAWRRWAKTWPWGE